MDTLSDFIRDDDDRENCILEVKDVKQFIKDLKDRLSLEGYQKLMVDELAGDKLI